MGRLAAGRWWRDRWYLAALCAGPIVWLVLASTSLVARPAGNPALALLLSSVLIMPVLEELAFRGLLQGLLLERASLARRRFGLSLANVIVSLLFAAAHLWSSSPGHAAAVFLPSLVFGACRDRYGSVLPGIVLHAFYNAGFVWLFAG